MLDTTVDDEVVPSRFWDEQDHMQKLVLEFTYRFDDVLDTGKLKSALERLLEIGDWRGLGARFRKNVSCAVVLEGRDIQSTDVKQQNTGKLECHIPRQYTAERPGFVWTQEVLNQRISDHPVASQLPKASAIRRPTLFSGSDIFHELVTTPNHATTFASWLETDLPALSIYVISFEDAKILTICWPHVLLDGLGCQTLLNAWTAVLNGRETDVPRFLPLHVDPVHEIARNGTPTSHVLYNYVLTGLWFALFVAGYMYELFVHSAEATRMICCPGPWVEHLRQQAIADVRAVGNEDANLFLSHGDVLLAWWVKVAVAAQGFSSRQPVNIMNVTNLRGLFPEELPETEKAAYIGNAAFSTYTLTTSGEVASIGVGELALRLRQDLQKQRSQEQSRHLIAWQLESKQQYGRMPLVGSWNQSLMGWSNWHRARFYDMDFSGAVLRPGIPIKNRANKLGQPSTILVNGHANGFSTRNVGPLTGRDANGDWWMQSVLRAGAWAHIEKQLGKM